MKDTSIITNGSIGELYGIPILESKLVPEGTYMCLDKNGLPTKVKKLIEKIVVHDLQTFKIAIINNLTK